MPAINSLAHLPDIPPLLLLCIPPLCSLLVHQLPGRSQACGMLLLERLVRQGKVKLVLLLLKGCGMRMLLLQLLKLSSNLT